MSNKTKINKSVTNGNLLALRCIYRLNKIVFTEIVFSDNTGYLNALETSNIEIDEQYMNDDLLFYSRILDDLISIQCYDIQLLDKIVHKMNQRNLFLFLKYLTILLTKKPELYKEPLIKLNISIIVGFFKSGLGDKLVNSIEYFYLCRKELEKNYGVQIDVNECEYDFVWKNMAQKEINNQETKIKYNYDVALEELYKFYCKNEQYEELEKIINIKNSILNLSREEIDKQYIHNKSYEKYLSDYLDLKLKKLGFIEVNNDFEERKMKMKNKLFFREIFNIDLNDINQVLYLLDCKLCNIDEFDSIDNVYKNHIKSYELLIEESKEDLTEELSTILKSDEFMDYLKEVLESIPVQNYLKNRRKFNEDNSVKFMKEDENDFDDNLRAGYERVMDNLKKKKQWLNDIIIIKYMSKKKRAFVNPLIRIVINPLYIEISELLKKENNNKRHDIFKAYLIIIIIHELIHICKFMKDKFNYSNIPQTPKNKEGGEIFIKHLFGLPIINKINYEQAIKINDIKNWESIDKLSKIFNDDNCKDEDKNYIRNKETQTKDLYSINYYLSDYENEDEDTNEKQDYWYDF